MIFLIILIALLAAIGSGTFILYRRAKRKMRKEMIKRRIRAPQIDFDKLKRDLQRMANAISLT